MSQELKDMILKVNQYTGTWKNSKLVNEIYQLLWLNYDPNNDLIYPTICDWDDRLISAIERDDFDDLNFDEVLSMLFGLHHRGRIVDGLKGLMFERGVTQILLSRLLVLESE